MNSRICSCMPLRPSHSSFCVQKGHGASLSVLSRSSLQRASNNRRPMRPQRALGAGDVVKLASEVCALAATAWVLTLQKSSEEEEADQHRFQDQQTCPRCNGSGYEPCICTRWSDGDTGCGTCRRSGYMKCRSCGGGGTAVPIPALRPIKMDVNKMSKY